MIDYSRPCRCRGFGLWSCLHTLRVSVSYSCFLETDVIGVRVCVCACVFLCVYLCLHLCPCVFCACGVLCFCFFHSVFLSQESQRLQGKISKWYKLPWSEVERSVRGLSYGKTDFCGTASCQRGLIMLFLGVAVCVCTLQSLHRISIFDCFLHYRCMVLKLLIFEQCI